MGVNKFRGISSNGNQCCNENFSSQDLITYYSLGNKRKMCSQLQSPAREIRASIFILAASFGWQNTFTCKTGTWEEQQMPGKQVDPPWLPLPQPRSLEPTWGSPCGLPVHSQSCRGQEVSDSLVPPLAILSLNHGTLTWIMIPLSLYSALSALENVHTKA